MYFVVIIASLLFITADVSDWQDLLKVFLSRAYTEPLDTFKACLGGKGIHPFHWAIFHVERK